MNQQPIGQRQITTEKAPRKNKTGMSRNNKDNKNGSDSGWRAIPPLPRYESVHKTKYQGPTDESNWVIPGILMAGAYPAAQEDNVHYSIIQSVLSLGISTFICLQAEYEHDPNIPEFMWRQGYKLRTYIFDALRILKAADIDPTKRLGLMCKPDKLDFRHVPIVDCSTTNDSIVLELAQDICKRLKRGENIYVHCWGGHGRAGTVVSIVLGFLYNLDPHEALKRCQQFHDTRRAPLGVPSPQTATQRAQVIRIIKKEMEKRKRKAAKAKKAAQNSNASKMQLLQQEQSQYIKIGGLGSNVTRKKTQQELQNQNTSNNANSNNNRSVNSNMQHAGQKKPTKLDGMLHGGGMVIDTMLVDEADIIEEENKKKQQQHLLPGISPINTCSHNNTGLNSNNDNANVSKSSSNSANVIRPLAPPKTFAAKQFVRNKAPASNQLGQLRRARASRPVARKRSISKVSNNSNNLKLMLGNNGNNRISETLPDGTKVTVFGGSNAISGNNQQQGPLSTNNSNKNNRGRPSTFGAKLPAAKTRRVMGTQHRKHQTGNSNNIFKSNVKNNMNQLHHNKVRYEKSVKKKNFVLNGAHVNNKGNDAQQMQGLNNNKKQGDIRHARPLAPAVGNKQQQSPRSRNLLQKKT
jgi:hypothetical protein